MTNYKIIILSIFMLISNTTLYTGNDDVACLEQQPLCEELLNEEVLNHDIDTYESDNVYTGNDLNDQCRYACAHVNYRDAKKLIGNPHVNVSAYNRVGYAPIHCVVVSAVAPYIASCPLSGTLKIHQRAIIKFLLTHGADINQPDLVEECTPLHLLVQAHPDNISLMRFLINAGADVDKHNNAGESALDVMQKSMIHYSSLWSLYAELAGQKQHGQIKTENPRQRKQLNMHD